jgi:hypothetical protein
MQQEFVVREEVVIESHVLIVDVFDCLKIQGIGVRFYGLLLMALKREWRHQGSGLWDIVGSLMLGRERCLEFCAFEGVG